MKFSITGVNHKTAPVEIRERLAFEGTSLSEALGELCRRSGVIEGMILSTCNRVEIAVASDDGADAGLAAETFLVETRNVEHAWLAPYLYRFEEREAIRHLFRVAASLDSMVVGEPQILGQLKTAYAQARDAGAVSTYLDTVLTRAFRVAKRVRSETDIGQSAVSISYAAVELAKQIFGSLADKKVMLAGAGKMSELAARHLRRAGVREILVTNRTAHRAAEVAARFDASTVPYERFVSRLAEVDILIASSGATQFILGKEELRRALEARKNQPMFLIDIAVPRNIDPAVNELEHAFLYDIDDLQQVVSTNVKARQQEAEDAERIVSEEVDRLLERLRAREISPTIVRLQDQLERLRLAELERMKGKFGALTPQQEEALEALTRGLINKIAHGPITEIRRQAAQPNSVFLIEAIRRIFRLED